MIGVVLATVLLVTVSACGSGADEVPTTTAAPETPPGAAQPEQAVAEVLRSLVSDNYRRAAELTVDGQMVLVALAEGAPVSEARLVAGQASEVVGENYWAGFAESLEGFLGYGPDDIRIGEISRFEVEGSNFARVEVFVPLDGSIRTFLVAEDDGWKVDVIGTFSSGLAGKLATAAETVRSDPDGAELLDLMRAHEASLLAALEDPRIGPEHRQAVLAAVEALRR